VGKLRGVVVFEADVVAFPALVAVEFPDAEPVAVPDACGTVITTPWVIVVRLFPKVVVNVVKDVKTCGGWDDDDDGDYGG